MSFPFQSGVMAPEEFAVVRSVYAQLITEKWFSRSAIHHDELAVIALDFYRRGVRDPLGLALRCRSHALVKYGTGAKGARDKRPVERCYNSRE